jgi:hypothetical protein
VVAIGTSTAEIRQGNKRASVLLPVTTCAIVRRAASPVVVASAGNRRVRQSNTRDTPIQPICNRAMGSSHKSGRQWWGMRTSTKISCDSANASAEVGPNLTSTYVVIGRTRMRAKAPTASARRTCFFTQRAVMNPAVSRAAGRR